MFPVVDVNKLRCMPSNVQNFPQEGPKAVPFPLDFSGSLGATLDLQKMQDNGTFSALQTLYIDNSQANAGTITITMQGTGQVLSIKANTQGYYPVLCDTRIVATFSSTGTNVAKGFALNVPVAPAQWATQ